MARRKIRKFSSEFRREAVRRVTLGDKAVAEVARELGISSKTLWGWVHRAEVVGGKGPPGELATTDSDELLQLRREVSQLREEREILKKATAFFAKESK
jgi:transposase